MQLRKLPSKPLYKRPLTWAIIAVVVASIAIGSYFYMDNRRENNTINPPNTVNYNEPTDEEKKETEEFKEQQQKEASNPPAPAPTPGAVQTVEPTITYIGQYDAEIEASAFISSVIEDGGTCTLTLKKNGTSQTVVKTTQGAKDARSTRCPLFTFAASELAKGSWTATISYDSAAARGVSKPATLEVK